jgi:hypothetical protein
LGRSPRLNHCQRGHEGHQEAGTSPGTGTTNEITHGWTAAEKKSCPIAYISWRDAIVWCNAYSEMSGREPYYTDSFYTTVLRISTNDSGTETVADGATMKPGANGYRLPTEAEWEYAGREPGRHNELGLYLCGDQYARNRSRRVRRLCLVCSQFL